MRAETTQTQSCNFHLHTHTLHRETNCHVLCSSFFYLDRLKDSAPAKIGTSSTSRTPHCLSSAALTLVLKVCTSGCTSRRLPHPAGHKSFATGRGHVGRHQTHGTADMTSELSPECHHHIRHQRLMTLSSLPFFSSPSLVLRSTR